MSGIAFSMLDVVLGCMVSTIAMWLFVVPAGRRALANAEANLRDEIANSERAYAGLQAAEKERDEACALLATAAAKRSAIVSKGNHTRYAKLHAAQAQQVVKP